MEYLSNKELYKEIIWAQEKGEYTRSLYKMMNLMIKKISGKFNYKRDEWRKDCEAYAHMKCFQSYRNFDYENKDNAFAFFTQVIKMAMAHQFNVITGRKRIQGGEGGVRMLDVINFSELFTENYINI
jgi:glycyl-tRNA synthetase alpha subunit